MDLILNNLQAVSVNIDYNRLAPGSYKLEDYILVMDKRPVDYGEDDGERLSRSKDRPIQLKIPKNGTTTTILQSWHL